MKKIFNKLAEIPGYLYSKGDGFGVKASQSKGLKKLAFNAAALSCGAGLVVTVVPLMVFALATRTVEAVHDKFKKNPPQP